MRIRPARKDDVLRALADQRRRRVLAYLREHGDATRDELVDVLTGWLATDRASGEADSEDHTRTALSLSHVALPKLDDVGLVTVDEETDTVALADMSPWVETCLDVVLDADWGDDGEVVRPPTESEDV